MEFANEFSDFKILGVEQASPNEKGEVYVICPTCDSERKKQGQKKLAVNISKGTWFCQHCGWTGGLTPSDWVKNKPIINKEGNSPLTDTQIKYFAKRGITKHTLEAREVKSKFVSIRQKHNDTFQEKLCASFIFRENGWPMMIKYRDGAKNFKIEKGSKLIPWGIDWIKNTEEYCIITEGEIDTLSYHEVGLIHCCSVPNGTTVSIAEKEYFVKTGKLDTGNHLSLSYFDNTYQYFEKKEIIYIATDDDAAGIKLRNEIGRRFGYEKCKIITCGDYSYEKDGKIINCNDPNDILMNLGIKALKSTIDHAKDFPMDDVVSIDDVMEKITEQFDFGLKKGKSTGFKDLDPHFRWKPGQLIGLNGYGGMGKSTIMFNMLILTAILYDWKWGCYLPENYPVEDAYIIFLEIWMGNTIDKDVKERATKEELQYAKKFISEHFEFVDREEGYTPKELRSVTKRMIMQRGIIGFVTDPWNSLNHIYTGSLDQYLENELSAEVRFTTANNIIKVVLMHPPTPQGEDRKDPSAPSMFQVTGGGVWSKKLYVILCFHQKDQSKEDILNELHVQKVKTPKLVGIKTKKDFPVLFRFHGRDHHFRNFNDSDPIKIAKGEKDKRIYKDKDITFF